MESGRADGLEPAGISGAFEAMSQASALDPKSGGTAGAKPEPAAAAKKDETKPAPSIAGAIGTLVRGASRRSRRMRRSRRSRARQRSYSAN